MNKEKKLLEFEKKNIYCITAEKFSNGRSNIFVVKQMLEAGIKILQYREKNKTFKEKYEECKILRQMTKEKGCIFIINDHPDLCLMCDADGVHLGQDDYPVKEVRKILGDKYIIGVSTHSKQQYQKAVEDGADYAGVGPLFETHTKDDVISPVGLEYLRWVVENKKIPFVAIGGIKEHNISEVIKSGAKCVCLVTEITQSENIVQKIKSLKNKIMES
jgi:thiamine-phosphate pyrophosphorylase